MAHSAVTAMVDNIERMALTPAALAALFHGKLDGDPRPSQALGEIVSDSRKIVEGGVFVALPGERDNGHAHVREATEAGAALAIVDRSWVPPVRRPDILLRVEETATSLRQACTGRLRELGCPVVAITGSVGKTTVKEMCAQVLAGSRHVAKTPGNMNTWTGVPLAVLNLDPPVDVFIAELAMSARGEIRDLTSFTRPHVGVVLNVGLAHVGLLGSIEEVAAAKAELLEAMPEGGIAVLNADDPLVAAMAPAASRVVWFGIENRDAQFWAGEIALRGFEGVDFVLHGPDGEAPVKWRFPGLHGVRNACATAAVAAQFGVGVAEIAQRLSTLEAPERRGRVLRGRSGALIYDDCYNSSPTSLAAALEVLARSGAGLRLAVVGDMLELGDLADAEHRRAGARVAAGATHLIAVGAHASTVCEGAVAAGMAAGRAVAVPNAEQAAAGADELIGSSADIAVLVKGSRGVALERVVEALTQ